MSEPVGVAGHLAACDWIFARLGEAELSWARERLLAGPRARVGRVLDHTVIDGFVNGSRHARALVRTALVEGVALVIPAAVLMVGWSRRGSGYEVHALRAVLDLPVVEVDPLDASAAFGAARLPAIRDDVLTDMATAHAVHSALTRGWPIVSAAPTRIRDMSWHGAQVDELPWTYPPGVHKGPD